LTDIGGVASDAAMNLRQLKYFVSVVEAGNMTRAAEQLHVAQTALGMQIRQLEEDLGVALLVRHSRGVEPTKAGALLLTRAIAILKSVEDARQEVSACDREEIEAIRLGTTPALMPVIGSEIALIVREQLPQVSLSIVEAMSHVLVDTLTRGEVDFILCYDVPDLPQLSRVAMLQDDLVLVTLPGPQKAKPIPLVEALEDGLAMPEEGDTVRTLVTRTARDLGLDVKIAHEVRSVSAMKSLVSRGAASSILPYFAVLDEVRAGTLDARPITMPALRRTLFLAHARQGGPYRSEAGLTGAVRSSLTGLIEALGPLVHPLWVRTAERSCESGRAAGAGRQDRGAGSLLQRAVLPGEPAAGRATGGRGLFQCEALSARNSGLAGAGWPDGDRTRRLSAGLQGRPDRRDIRCAPGRRICEGQSSGHAQRARR
jgi:LysR family nitrogen assimilation transcriptional regulator